MKRAAAALLIVFAAAATAFGGDSEFDRVVRAIESHYGTRPLHIPFMGLANLAVKVARPEGATEVKVAVFEDLPSTSGRDAFMDSIASPQLRPFVRTHSNHNEEATYIFIGPISKSTKMLIATFSPNNATVVEVKANIESLLKSLEEPTASLTIPDN